MLRTDWGPEFFEHFYLDPSTRIVAPEQLAGEGYWLGMTLTWRLGIEVKTAVDLGSGTGKFAEALDGALVPPWARERGTVQTHRIDLYGPDVYRIRKDIRGYSLTGYDLIVCRDVLHYLEDDDAETILLRMRGSGAKALYVRVSTDKDQPIAESDAQIVLRPTEWYADRLFARGSPYTSLGFGLYVRNDLPVDLGALE